MVSENVDFRRPLKPSNLIHMIYFHFQICIQWNLALVNFWVVKKLSLVNKILCLPGSLYTINHMLNSKNLTIVKKFGDKTDFFIARFHCTYELVFQCKKFVFGEIDLLFWDFPWFGLCLAFLASMASKTKMMLKPDLLLPYDLRNVEKLLKFIIFQLWPK